jgi:DNA-3-methyladenine glycosylase II
MPEEYNEGVWRRAITLEAGNIVPVELRSVGSVEEPKMEVKTFCAVNKQEKEELEKKLDALFSFSQDLTELYSFMDEDSVLNELKQRFFGLKAGSMGTTVFEHIVKSIIQQQISIRVAFSITNKMVTKFGDQTTVENRIFYDFPTPKQFTEASLEEVRGCGVSWKKAEYIKTVAQKTVEGEFDPESLWHLSNEQIVETLTEFRGVGKWTAEMVLSAGLKRNATVPAGDLGVRRTFSKFYSKEELFSEAEVRQIADDWGEFTKDIVFYISCIERT